MATFHAIRRLDLTIMVDDSRTTVVFKHYVYFLIRFLHIFKDISYDFNNFFSSSQYQIPTTSFQKKQWVVGFGRYSVVKDRLTPNLQETIDWHREQHILWSKLGRKKTTLPTISLNV
jgi:hypothetical protein